MTTIQLPVFDEDGKLIEYVDYEIPPGQTITVHGEADENGRLRKLDQPLVIKG